MRLNTPLPRPRFEILINNRRVRLGERTLIAGVLNVTPDSFSDGGRFSEPRKAIQHAIAMARAGADWIDVGGESTRPGARPVTPDEELRRVLPVIRGIYKRLPQIPISIDTTKAVVADAAIQAGASIINDVSGLRFDPAIGEVARQRRVPLVLMHMHGRPSTMQQRPFARFAMRSVMRGLAWSVQKALALGVRRSQLIVDPGLGFGKSRRQNYELIARLSCLRGIHLPVMVGASRKSFIQAVVRGEEIDSAAPRGVARRKRADYWAITKVSSRLKESDQAALDCGDAAAVAASIVAGAHIIRVHNVAAAVAAARVADAVLAAVQLTSLPPCGN